MVSAEKILRCQWLSDALTSSGPWEAAAGGVNIYLDQMLVIAVKPAILHALSNINVTGSDDSAGNFFHPGIIALQLFISIDALALTQRTFCIRLAGR